MSPTPAIALTPGAEINGFRLHSATAVPEVRSVAYLLEHPASGARLLHLHTADPENLFSVTFPTPSSDDTGVPHILEHCVLAGSRRFPVREPFFEMIKMSMATFINAMTGEDTTYYPVASNVPKDLFNLAEVYFDAVFHPLLTEQTFRREGHHLAPVPADGQHGNGGAAGGNRLAISGIVYNEMKGAFSDPDASLARLLNHGLLPDTIYAHESGGTPEAIPDLTYETFRRFHANYYHPSNAYFFAYGDIATADYCGFLDQRLGGFARRAVGWPAGVAGDRFDPVLQRRWTAQRALRERYPIGANEPADERTYLINAWLTGDALDPGGCRPDACAVADSRRQRSRSPAQGDSGIGTGRRPDLLRQFVGGARGHLRDRHSRQRGRSRRALRRPGRHDAARTSPPAALPPTWWRPRFGKRRSSTSKCSRCFLCTPCSGWWEAGSTAPTRCASCALALIWPPAANAGSGSRICSPGCCASG